MQDRLRRSKNPFNQHPRRRKERPHFEGIMAENFQSRKKT